MNIKLSILSIALVSAVGINACVIWPSDDHDDDDGLIVEEPDPYVDPAVYTTIDADHILDTDLGLGAGMFVEYGTGGRWTLWTSCDTDLTGGICFWQANVTAHSGSLVDLLEYDTESGDYVESYGDNSITFYAETDVDSDALEFYADPGAYVEVELYLDGYIAPEYFVWYGNGIVHNGASGSPVVFQPNQD